ncbi:MAG: hypothetical protein ACTSPQ_11735, partial [Candidatus Helarchaeota archaeon]
MSGLKVLGWNDSIMEEKVRKSKELTEDEEEIEEKKELEEVPEDETEIEDEEKSIEELELELKNLKRKIEASSAIVKEKIKNTSLKSSSKLTEHKQTTTPIDKSSSTTSTVIEKQKMMHASAKTSEITSNTSAASRELDPMFRSTIQEALYEIPEEVQLKKLQEEEIKKLWGLYKWAAEHEKFPWMYWIPSKESGDVNWKENFESWKNEWCKFTVDWARAFILHILDMYEVAKEKPYIYLNNREKALDIIFKSLVDMKRGKSKLAQWIGKDKNKIRIYWRSLEE